MSTARTNAEAPTVGWMALRSMWMLATLIPGAVASWVGFIYIGIAGRMPRWIGVGVAVGALTVLAHTPILGQWRPVGIVVVYVGAMLLALAANPSWLRASWLRGAEAGTATAQRSTTRASTARSNPSRTASAAPSQRRRSGQRSTTRTAKPSTRSEPVAEAAAVGASSAPFFAPASEPEQSPDTIDVNTASTNALAGLPGISRNKARDLNKRRDAMGGWPSLEAFETAAALQPHELMRLRQTATCSPRKRTSRAFGRRVDL